MDSHGFVHCHMYGAKNAERNFVFASISQSNMESSMSGILNLILSLFFVIGWKNDLGDISL